MLIFGANLNAQFGPGQLINLPTDPRTGRQYISIADVDGDGRPDILVATNLPNTVRYFHNQGGFVFDAPVVLPGTWLSLKALETADINSDGLPDMFTMDMQTDKLFWHPNVGGTFPEQILITEDLEVEFSPIICRDFTDDGIIDVVILNHTNALLFRNDGLGNLAAPTKVVALEDETEFYDIVAGYFNDDDFIDLAITSSGFEIFLNDGTGNFTKAPGGGIEISFLLESADYNNDGLDDILMDASTLVPYQNSPTGFSVVGAFSPNNENYQTIFSSDLDNDGDLDVLSEDDQTNSFFWYENVEGGSSWIRHTLSTGPSGSSIFGVSAADLDGDGDNDLIRTSSNGEVAIYENMLIVDVPKMNTDMFTISPNPVSGYLRIDGPANENFDIALLDMQGKVLLQRENVSLQKPIDISGIKNGHYLLKIITGKSVAIKKLVIFQ